MKSMMYNAAMQEALLAEFESNKDYVFMGEDVGKNGGGMFKNGLYERYGGQRCIDMPIAENLIVAAAMGMSLGGMRGVAELMFADFVTLAMDPIVNEAAKYRFNAVGKASVPLTVISFVGVQGRLGCVHSQSTEGWIANTPGLKIVIPSFAADAKGLLTACLRDDDPTVFFGGRACMFTKGDVPEGEYVVPIGKANVVKEGKDVTVVAWHRALLETLALIDELEAEGISVEVVDPRSLLPFDYETVAKSVHKTGRLLVASEAPKRFSCTGEIVSFVAEECFADLKKPPVRLGSYNTPIPSFDLEDKWALSRDQIKPAIERLMD